MFSGGTATALPFTSLVLSADLYMSRVLMSRKIG
jgi:hypothetical protein